MTSSNPRAASQVHITAPEPGGPAAGSRRGGARRSARIRSPTPADHHPRQVRRPADVEQRPEAVDHRRDVDRRGDLRVADRQRLGMGPAERVTPDRDPARIDVGRAAGRRRARRESPPAGAGSTAVSAAPPRCRRSGGSRRRGRRIRRRRTARRSGRVPGRGRRRGPSPAPRKAIARWTPRDEKATRRSAPRRRRSAPPPGPSQLFALRSLREGPDRDACSLRAHHPILARAS